MCEITHDKTVHARHIKTWASELVQQAEYLLKKAEAGDAIDPSVEDELCKMANDLDEMAHGSPVYRATPEDVGTDRDPLLLQGGGLPHV